MILHDAIYEWDGKSRDGEKPICWWPGSYRIRIVDLESNEPGVLYIKSTAVICKNRGGGSSIKKCMENFSEKITKKYGLELSKVLWVEIERRDPTEIQVAHVSLSPALGGKTLYTSTWRPIRPNELKLLEPFFHGMDTDPPEERSGA